MVISLSPHTHRSKLGRRPSGSDDLLPPIFGSAVLEYVHVRSDLSDQFLCPCLSQQDGALFGI